MYDINIIPKSIPNKEDMERLYIDLNLSRKNLASIFDVSEATIKRWLSILKVKKDVKLRIANTNETLYKRYGVTHNSQTEQFKQSLKETNNKKYGVDYYFQSDDYKVKNKQTLKEKYGDEKYVNKELYNQTMMEKYGTTKSAWVNMSNDTRELLSDKDKLIKYINDNDIKTESMLAYKLGVSNTTICTYTKLFDIRDMFNGTSTSTPEIELREYIQTFYETINNSRTIIKPLELDIFIPQKNIAIEFNGDYWHNYEQYPKRKELDELKYKLCEEKGIKLLTIWEHEWNNNKEQIKDNLRKLLTEE